MSDDTVIGEGRWLSLRKMPNGYEYMTRINSTGVVVVAASCNHPDTFEPCLIMVSQFRPPVGTTVVELPAGLAGDHESEEGEEFVDAARREVQEETGYTGGKWKLECITPTNPGAMKGKLHIYSAIGLEKTHEGGGVGNENIETHVIPFSKLEEWLAGVQAAGWVVDHKIYTGLYLLGARRRT